MKKKLVWDDGGARLDAAGALDAARLPKGSSPTRRLANTSVVFTVRHPSALRPPHDASKPLMDPFSIDDYPGLVVRGGPHRVNRSGRALQGDVHVHVDILAPGGAAQADERPAEGGDGGEKKFHVTVLLRGNRRVSLPPFASSATVLDVKRVALKGQAGEPEDHLLVYKGATMIDSLPLAEFPMLGIDVAMTGTVDLVVTLRRGALLSVVRGGAPLSVVTSASSKVRAAPSSRDSKELEQSLALTSTNGEDWEEWNATSPLSTPPASMPGYVDDRLSLMNQATADNAAGASRSSSPIHLSGDPHAGHGGKWATPSGKNSARYAVGEREGGRKKKSCACAIQ